MKHVLSILLILTLSISGFAQKKPVAKKKAQPKTAVSKKEVVVEEVKPEKIKPDTLQVQKGKKYVFLVDVSEYSGQSDVAYVDSNEENSEKAELLRNFPKENLEIINIKKYTYILFENKQTLDITGDGKSFQALAYWGGKMDDKVQVKEGTKMATEFVGEQIRSKKESSYVVNTKKYKKEVASLQNKNKITSKSRETLKALLNGYALPFADIRSEEMALYQQGTAKLKTIDSYIIKNKGARTPLKSIAFDNDGLPTSVSFYDREGKSKGKKEFVYKDGMLSKIMKDDQEVSSVNYDDNKIVITENVGDANQTTIFWLENGKLLRKSYTLMADDKFSYMNNFVEEKFENNCVVYYINNVVWTRDCSGASNVYPFVHTYTSFQNKEVLQFRKSKIEKKDDRTYEKFYSTAERAEQNDFYKPWGTIHFDEMNLVDMLKFTKDNNEQTIKIDYTCYE